jgi:DNA-binding MarR family transcriptional regulator
MVRIVNDSLTIANRLRPTLVRLGRHLRREVHSIGVTGGQVSLLFQIKREPGITARDLAELEQVSAAAMSVHLTRLESAGLIRRQRAGDRRRVGLFVTEDGDRVLRSVKKRRTAWLAARLERLTPEERAAIEDALPALERLLEDQHE